jgi:hypothetical protein
METNPKTIKIFLLDGKPTGPRTIEISGWTGKGFIIPRSNLSDVLRREDLKVPCVYFLIGEDDEGETVVYVGESESFIERIQYHNRDQNKDFWNSAICFVSKDETLNKAYVKYLESILFAEVKKVGRVKVESGKDSNPARLSESDLADANDFAEHIRLLLPVAGFTFLKAPIEDEHKEVWYCKGKDANAIGMQTSEGFVVRKGSVIQGSETNALHDYVKLLRKKILTPETKVDEKSFKLKEDEVFGSPSTAAAFVLGRSANGWTSWKNSDGQTLDEIKRQNT